MISHIRSALSIALLAGSPGAVLATHSGMLGFVDDVTMPNSLRGQLAGSVQFAQSHTIHPAGNSAKERPSLVSERESLVAFFPAHAIPESDWQHVKVEAFRGEERLGELVLAPPSLFPASDEPDTQPVERPRLNYSTKAWTTTLPWHWMTSGLSLRFSYGLKHGTLDADKIDFTGPAELVLQNIRIGMLTPATPASQNWFESETVNAAIDYFQKIPVAKLTVGQYLPLELDRVVMPGGQVYTDASPDQGTWHTGDMREHIGKELISEGINLANFGFASTASMTHLNRQDFRQIVQHQSIGVYANGVQPHGYSGGGGKATLWDLNNNELSHELGHNFGLGHYPGGGRWSSHHQDSGWGYDAFRKRMIANIRWNEAPVANVIEGYTTQPFKGLYRFGSDPMAGADESGTISKYTLHTGYSAKRVQQAMVATPVIDSNSPTGFSQWNATSRTMVPTPGRQRPTRFGVPVVTLVGFYDPRGILPTTMYPPMHGNFGLTYAYEAPAENDCRIIIRSTKGWTEYKLHSSRLNSFRMNKFHVNVAQSEFPSAASIQCVINHQRVTLARLDITAAGRHLPPPTVIGKDAGYAAAIGLPALKHYFTSRFTSVAKLERAMSDIYGEARQWTAGEGAAAVGSPGTLYATGGPFSDNLRYYMLKTPGYGPFPTDGDNSHWRQIGAAGALVNWMPEPLTALSTPGATLDARIATYYGVDTLKLWVSGDRTAKPGDIYVYQNPYSNRRQYFMLKTERYGPFPVDGSSNGEWRFLGDATALEKIFHATKADRQVFEQALLTWHGQSHIREWSSTDKSGKGEIFRYANGGRVDYFRLKTDDYHYFPTNQTSNYYWEYLGSLK